MTDSEITAAIALARLRYYPDSTEEKFVKSIANRAKREWWCELSWRQKKFLWELVLRHRKKIGDAKLIQEAEEKIFGHHQLNFSYL